LKDWGSEGFSGGFVGLEIEWLPKVGIAKGGRGHDLIPDDERKRKAHLEASPIIIMVSRHHDRVERATRGR
jgi:hypothetical protein